MWGAHRPCLQSDEGLLRPWSQQPLFPAASHRQACCFGFTFCHVGRKTPRVLLVCMHTYLQLLRPCHQRDALLVSWKLQRATCEIERRKSCQRRRNGLSLGFHTLKRSLSRSMPPLSIRRDVKAGLEADEDERPYRVEPRRTGAAVEKFIRNSDSK